VETQLKGDKVRDRKEIQKMQEVLRKVQGAGDEEVEGKLGFV
jgi:hypothetical protein